MQPFNWYQPTKIHFACGAVEQAGEIARTLGKRCLLVTGTKKSSRLELYSKVTGILEDSGLAVFHYDGVRPNPTTAMVSAGAAIARKESVDLVVGLGGGSSIDTAKAIAVEAAHEGSAWDYLFNGQEPTENTLPVMAITTTSGTGSHVTPCAVMTNPDIPAKSAIWHNNAIPDAALVDPQLMLSCGRETTAVTGFDVFAHLFESYISVKTNRFVEVLAIEGLTVAIRYLPLLLDDLENIEYRTQLAWADTLAGICISSAGVTLPHGLGMQIGGFFPHVPHGLSLAVTYPEFTRFTWEKEIDKFARVARIFDQSLATAEDSVAAMRCCDLIDGFLQKIGLWVDFGKLKIPAEMIEVIASHGMDLPDYLNNPRVASSEEMFRMLEKSSTRPGI